MAASIKLVQGDTGPPLQVQLNDQVTGAAIDLSTATAINLKLYSEGATTVLIDTLTGTKIAGRLRSNGTTDTSYTTPGSGGLIQFAWTAFSLSQSPGYYVGELEITYADTTFQRVYDTLRFYLRESPGTVSTGSGGGGGGGGGGGATSATLVTTVHSGTGAISRTVADILNRDIPITPFDFGASGDGVTNDSAALALMATYVNSLYDSTTDGLSNKYHPSVLFPPCAGFLTTVGLVLSAGCELNMQSPLLVSAAAGTAIVGLTYSNAHTAADNAPRNTSPIFDVRRVTPSNWSNEGDIGVKIDAAYGCQPYFKHVEGFCIDVEMCDGYGNVRFGDIRDCKFGVQIVPRGPTHQFTNASRFVGGAFAVETNNGTSRYGVRIKPNATSSVNSIVWEGPSFELNLARAQTGNPSAEAIPLIFDATANNIADIVFRDVRSEGNSPTQVRASGSFSNISVGFTYIDDASGEFDAPEAFILDDQGTTCHDIHVYRQSQSGNGLKWKKFFDTGRLVERALKVTGGACYFPNLEVATSVGAAPATQTFAASGTGMTFDSSGNLSANSPDVGTRVKLNGARALAVAGVKPAGVRAGFRVLCFAANGTQIYGSNIVFSNNRQAIAVNTGAFGGFYQVDMLDNQSPYWNATYFQEMVHFDSSVDTVFIANIWPVSRWTLKAMDIRPVAFSTSSPFKDKFVTANLKPIAFTNVTYPTGMRVDNIAPATNVPSYWITRDGTNWSFDSFGLTWTWDPSNLPDGFQTTTSNTLTGAAMGDTCTCSFTNDLQGQALTAYVSAANTVTVLLRNTTGGAINLASGSLTVRVFPQS